MMAKYLEFNFKGTALTMKQLQKGRGVGQWYFIWEFEREIFQITDDVINHSQLLVIVT